MSTWKDDKGLPNNPMVVAPCCRRIVPADMLANVSMLPNEKRILKKHPLVYACDGCKERLYSTGKLKPSELAEASGVDASKVARLKAKEGRKS